MFSRLQRLWGSAPSRFESVVVEWEGQPEDSRGCAIACLAMLLGVDFEEAACRVPIYEPAVGIVMPDLLRVLGENGWAYQEKWPDYSPARAQRPRWPLRPWAPVHACAVRAGGWHCVIMLSDGTVLDPLSPLTRTLDAYEEVFQMVGLWRVA